VRRRRSSFFGDWYEAPPKQPVPKHGIAASRFGATWWGREWILSLERLGRQWSNRLPRGRSYARQGRVVDLEVGAGVITAGVVGTRPSPYRVEICLPAFAPEKWRAATERLADDALLVVRLLQRELPDEAGERLREVDADLFPSRGELATQCSCPDVANPCKHVAAVHYLFAAALDNDPFLLFRLRGLDRDALVAALGGEGACEAAPADCGTPAAHSPGVERLERLATIDAQTFLGLDLSPPVVDVEPRAPRVELVGVKRLGPPPRGLEGLPEALAPVIREAGRLALELAWREPDAAVSTPGLTAPSAGLDRPPPPPPRRRRRSPSTRVSPAAVEGLVRRVESELSAAGRPLFKRELLALVGAGDAEVTCALRTLRNARLVVTQGRGPATRYAPVEVAASPGGPRRVRRRNRAAGDLADRVVKALASARQPLPLRTIAEIVASTPEQLRSVLVALRQNGVVEMTGRRRSARYRLR